MVNSGYSNFFIDKYILKFRTKFLKNKTIAFHVPKNFFLVVVFSFVIVFCLVFFCGGRWGEGGKRSALVKVGLVGSLDKRLAFLKIDLFLTQIIFWKTILLSLYDLCKNKVLSVEAAAFPILVKIFK